MAALKFKELLFEPGDGKTRVVPIIAAPGVQRETLDVCPQGMGRGRVKQINQGHLFVNDLGDLPIDLQPFLVIHFGSAQFEESVYLWIAITGQVQPLDRTGAVGVKIAVVSDVGIKLKIPTRAAEAD
jgi:hypothetical protein